VTRRRKIVFACIAFAMALVATVGSLLAIDIYLHYRVQRLDLNVWGYRGPAAGRKKPGETRIAALGGSTVFGYGVPWNESWPYYLERDINAARTGRAPASVVNLGAPRDSAATFATTIDDYDYLAPEVVVLYEGYNDLESPGAARGSDGQLANYLAWRHQSPVFRWTGYLPILPLVFAEKASSLLHGGDVSAAYGSRDIVFRPGLATRVTAGTLKATADIEVALERRFGRLTDGGAAASTAYDASCGRWSEYCGAVREAVRNARRRGLRAIVVTQPYLSDLHVDQQSALEASLRRDFSGDSAVRYVNLGHLVDLHDSRLAYDGIHLTATGNQRVAAALAPVVLDVMP
jgi:lysophospholipase L1-like esterase